MQNMELIKKNTIRLINSIPKNIEVVAATKSRSVEEIKEAVSGGIKLIGENYVQEAKEKYAKLKGIVSLHMIGHLQTNKVKDAVGIFDMIQTVDSLKIAKELNKRTKKLMPVLIEINIGHEKNKSGIFPEDVLNFLNSFWSLKNLSVKGLMTVEPLKKNPEEYRPYFRKMKALFEDIRKKKILSMEILSMGMSDSYMVAIEEGSTMIRIGAGIFVGSI